MALIVVFQMALPCAPGQLQPKKDEVSNNKPTTAVDPAQQPSDKEKLDAGAENQPNSYEQTQLKKNDPAFKSIKDRTPIVESSADNPVEFAAFLQILRHAHALPPQWLEQHGLPNVAYESLMGDETRSRHLRSLLKLRGRETMIHHLQLPPELKNANIKALYEAQIYIENDPSKTVRVIFMELPPGLTPATSIAHDVVVDGYFFKLMEYVGKVGDERVKKYEPLLLARTIVVQDEEVKATSAELPEAVRIKLDKSLPYWDAVEDERPMMRRDENLDEYTAFNLTVLQAHEFSPESLRANAQRDIVFADLLNDYRGRYQRELLHVEGTLVRLHQIDATERLKATSPIKHLYEGWIVHESNQEHLINVVFIDLPPGLKLGDRVNYRVAFDGYYFKLLGYKTKEKNPNKPGEFIWRKAPLLIGHTIEVLEPAEDVWSLGNPLIPAMMTAIALLGVGVIILMIWFRHSDRKVHDQMFSALNKANPFPAQGAPPPVEPGSDWNRIEQPPGT